MKILQYIPELMKILSLIGILLTGLLKPVAPPTPIKVTLPEGTGASEIIAAFVADLERAEEQRRYPPAEPIEPVQAIPVRPEEWIRSNNGQWMIKPEK